MGRASLIGPCSVSTWALGMTIRWRCDRGGAAQSRRRPSHTHPRDAERVLVSDDVMSDAMKKKYHIVHKKENFMTLFVTSPMTH